MAAVVAAAWSFVAGTAAAQSDGAVSRGGEVAAKSDVAIDIPGVTAADANADRIMKVIVTGVGIDQAQAKANALAKAVEQTVGLMVDAETLVRNEELLRDKVLTYTRGDVKKAVILKEWTEDDLHFTQVQAEVVASQIAERLRKSSIELRPVPGELFYHTAKERRRNLQNAAEMLARQMKDFHPANYLTLTPVGEPEAAEQDDAMATLNLKFRVAADLPKYMEFRWSMQELLRHMSSTRLLATCLDHSSDDSPFRALDFSPEKANHMYYRVQKDGADFGYWIFMNQTFIPSAEPNIVRSQWEGYRVDKALFQSFEPLAARTFQLVVTLLDDDGQEVTSTTTPLQSAGYDLLSMRHEDNPSWRREMIFIGPFVWRASEYADQPDLADVTLTLPTDDLRRVRTSKAEIVETSKP